jgi:hypothetical protein
VVAVIPPVPAVATVREAIVVVSDLALELALVAVIELPMGRLPPIAEGIHT